MHHSMSSQSCTPFSQLLLQYVLPSASLGYVFVLTSSVPSFPTFRVSREHKNNFLLVGDYDVTLPDSTSPGEYKIRVGLFEDSDLFGCSETFEVVDEGQGPDESEFSFNFEMLDGGDAEANWWEGDGAAFFP